MAKQLEIAGRMRKRFGRAERDRVIRWLEKQVSGPSPRLLTWPMIERYSGFSKMRLSQDMAVVAAYKRAREASKRAVAEQRLSERRKEGRQQDPETELQRLIAQIKNWLVLWERWQYNAGRMGWDVRELEKPLPEAVHRKVSRNG